MSLAVTDVPASEPLLRARRLLAQGLMGEAVQAYETVLKLDPGHLEALNAMAMAALRQGDRVRAMALLQQALGHAPQDPLSLNNLAQAYQAGGELEAALQCYRDLLQLKPEIYAARLSAARLLEALGRADQALPHYFRAVSDAQRDGRWLSAESTPRGLQPLVQHAMQCIDQGREALFAPMLHAWRQRYGASEIERSVHCLRLYLGQAAPAYPDPQQRPSFLFFPGLPASPYLDKRQLPQTQILEQRWPVVREELLRLLGSEEGSERVFHSEALEQANLRGERGPPKWNGYYFNRHGERREENCRACPQTAALLDDLPLCRIMGHAPETMFSVLSPGTHLLPHQGITNTRVVGHLALIVPPDCALRVVDQPYHWREGEVVIFDDSYWHEAWNRSDRLRVVLIFDLWHPELSLAEREMVSELVTGIGDFRQAGEHF